MRPSLTLLAVVSLVSPLAAQVPFDFYARGPYRPAVPRPEAITGYPAGEQHTMYAVMQHYLDTLVATASDRVRIETWGRTTEYRPIRALIISDPANLAKPDGHDRVAAWYNSIAVGADHPFAFEQAEPWSITGRYSHFRFDMNRDLLAQSQPEVRAMMDGVMRWRPQVFVDHHSTTATFFFPPVAQAVNMNLPPQTTKWFDTYGRGNAAAFDRYGWQYQVRGVFDFFYVGYWDEWSTFQGATGMTYETDGGREFNNRRDDGTITTLRDGIAHHFVASLA